MGRYDEQEQGGQSGCHRGFFVVVVLFLRRRNLCLPTGVVISSLQCIRVSNNVSVVERPLVRHKRCWSTSTVPWSWLHGTVTKTRCSRREVSCFVHTKILANRFSRPSASFGCTGKAATSLAWAHSTLENGNQATWLSASGIASIHGSCCDGNSLLLITTSANGLCGRRDIIRELSSAYPPNRSENETVRLPSTSRSHAGSSSQKRPKSGAGFVVDEASSENSACLPYPLKLRMTSRIHAGSQQPKTSKERSGLCGRRDII